MILTSLGPCLPGAVLGGEPLLYIVFAQIPMYVVAMTMAAFKLNKMLVVTMRAERESDYRARHDALTGLANRTGLIDAVDRKLVRADASAAGFALLFLDLDGFKSINDRFGHAAGDRMLEMVAERMRRMLRPADIAARIGGDEFLVVAEGLTAEQALDLGRRLIHAVATSYELDNGSSSTIGVSVGIALAPEHGSDFETLSAVADAALYEAKSTGKLRCCMGSPLKASAAAHRRRAKDLHSRQIGAAA
jgi:diguanylate cyclase (GGDEF)-like protein